MRAMSQVKNSLKQKFRGSRLPWTIYILTFIASVASLIPFLKNNITKAGWDNDILAVIANRIIYKKSFITRYNERRVKFGLPDNGRSRSEIFNTMLEEGLLIAEAERRGYGDDAAGRFELERIQIQELLEAYHQRFISDGMAVSEDELRRVFVRFNTKIKARHLYAASFKKDDSLYRALQTGKSFEELASENFQDPELHETGGSVGYFSIDEMDPSFEDAALSLNLGEISKPVRTAQGYSIIQVQD